jgi:hypothetical protein
MRSSGGLSRAVRRVDSTEGSVSGQPSRLASEATRVGARGVMEASSLTKQSQSPTSVPQLLPWLAVGAARTDGLPRKDAWRLAPRNRLRAGHNVLGPGSFALVMLEPSEANCVWHSMQTGNVQKPQSAEDYRREAARCRVLAAMASFTTMTRKHFEAMARSNDDRAREVARLAKPEASSAVRRVGL